MDEPTKAPSVQGPRSATLLLAVKPWGEVYVDGRKIDVLASGGVASGTVVSSGGFQFVSAGGTAAACTSPSNHVDSVLALDMATGAIKWAYRAVEWNQPFVANGTDDWKPILGEVPGFPGFFMNMFPWMGFTAGPISAQVTAELGVHAPLERTEQMLGQRLR